MDQKERILQSALRMPVQSVLQQWPQAAPVFLKYRMNCIGCSMDVFDSLSDALNSYAIPAETFLHELSQAMDNEVTS